MNLLPEDILFLIGDYLEYYQILRLKQVCKRYNNIFIEKYWKRFDKTRIEINEDKGPRIYEINYLWNITIRLRRKNHVPDSKEINDTIKGNDNFTELYLDIIRRSKMLHEDLNNEENRGKLVQELQMLKSVPKINKIVLIPYYKRLAYLRFKYNLLPKRNCIKLDNIPDSTKISTYKKDDLILIENISERGEISNYYILVGSSFIDKYGGIPRELRKEIKRNKWTAFDLSFIYAISNEKFIINLDKMTMKEKKIRIYLSRTIAYKLGYKVTV
jgi:hypothetical protein